MSARWRVKLWQILAVILLVVAGPARADTDQRCLSTCISNGKAGGECLQQCTYNIVPKTPPAIPSVTLQDLEAHRELAVPMPATDDVLPKSHKVTSPAPQIDRPCLANCLREGMQYGLCKEQCIIPTCAAGIILCKKQQNPYLPAQSHPINH